jgi:hypothetical protein
MMLLQLNYPYRWPTISQYNWNYVRMTSSLLWKKSLKIPKGQSEFVHQRRTDNTMTKRKSWIQGVVKYFLRSRICDALTVNQVCQVIIEKGWTSWIPLRGWGNDYKCVFINLMYRYIYIYRVYIVKKRKYFYGMTFFPRWRRTSQICCYSTKR